MFYEITTRVILIRSSSD